MAYRGRFAPSPTGPLHAGSLLTAVGSFLDARAHQGAWLVRIEDTDRYRTLPDAEYSILQALEAYQLTWDEAIVRQSEREALYHERLEWLIAQQRAYRCSCSRSELQARYALAQYDRYCLHSSADSNKATAVRFLSGPAPSFDDRILGQCTPPDEQELGDFILYRRDQVFAYHLAVVIDDYEQKINRIVRGADLIWETPKHLQLQSALGYQSPSYAHLPLIVNEQGQKLSKQTRAEALSLQPDIIRDNLYRALIQLGQNPPPDLRFNRPDEILAWGVNHWDIGQVPNNDLYLSCNL